MPRKEATKIIGLGEGLCAAEYVRMSTEHQRYSIENQTDTIRLYAAERNIKVVQTYMDYGKSGLTLQGRAGLERLLEDVQAGRNDYSLVLVYDVSRWGRFQNYDESAFYEHLCKRAGARIIYCAETFPDDESGFSAVHKVLRRIGAADFSRDLSVKVSAGKRRLIEKGFRQGGHAGLGLRRLVVGENGRPKGILKRGEQKGLTIDRVILIPGPREEVEQVWRIYDMFIYEKLSYPAMITRLNAEGPCPSAANWTRGILHGILTNRKYMGDNVYHMSTTTLRTPRVVVPQDQWFIHKRAFQGLVSPRLFRHAQAEAQRRFGKYPKEYMKQKLLALLKRKGRLSFSIINSDPKTPHTSSYCTHFNGLRNAYAAIGYYKPSLPEFVEIRKERAKLHAGLFEQICSMYRWAGIKTEWDPDAKRLIIADSWKLSLALLRGFIPIPSRSQSTRWNWLRRGNHVGDAALVVRLEIGRPEIKDMFLVRRSDIPGLPISLAANSPRMEPYRISSLDQLIGFSPWLSQGACPPDSEDGQYALRLEQ